MNNINIKFSKKAEKKICFNTSIRMSEGFLKNRKYDTCNPRLKYERHWYVMKITVMRDPNFNFMIRHVIFHDTVSLLPRKLVQLRK